MEVEPLFLRGGTIDLLVRFSADGKLLGPTKLKNHLCHFILLLPPDSDISLALVGPQKSFTYQKLQDLMRKTAGMVSNPANEAIFHEIMTENLATLVFIFSQSTDPTF